MSKWDNTYWKHDADWGEGMRDVERGQQGKGEEHQGGGGGRSRNQKKQEEFVEQGIENAEEKEAAAKLTHELANLLDGSLRCLGLAMRSIDKSCQAEQGEEKEKGCGVEERSEHEYRLSSESVDAVIKKLRTADGAMRQMAMLIHQWMKTPRSQRDGLEWIVPGEGVLGGVKKEECLGDAIQLLDDMHREGLEHEGVELRVEVSEKVKERAAGPMMQIVENLLQNSIDAVMDKKEKGGANLSIEVVCDLEGEDVVVKVRDSGGGFSQEVKDEEGEVKFGVTSKQEGNGIGLTLCRDVAASLGGGMEVKEIEDGSEVVVRVKARELRG